MDAEGFLRLLAARHLAEGERIILCGFPGDPFAAGPHAWKPRPWRDGDRVGMPEGWNGYATVAAFRRASDGSWRRRTENFAAGLALMVDDVGTKIPLERTAAWPEPTVRIETSSGNEQWWYMLREAERDRARFDGVIRAFIAGQLLGADPGMSGVTRVGRLPGFVNGKPVNKGWRCAVRALGERRYSVGELLEGFGLAINGRRERRERLPTEAALERNRAYTVHYRWLEARGMLKREHPDPSGWTEVRCPWVEEHTGRSDTGAAIREPSDENEFYGAFRCHHGHCAGRGWSELTEWIAERSVEELEGSV